MTKVPVHRRLAAKMSSITVLLVAVTIGYFAIAIYYRDYRTLEARYGQMLQRIVTMSAQRINAKQHQQIRTINDQNSPAFQHIQQLLKQIQTVHKLKPGHVFTLHTRPQTNNAPPILSYGVLLQNQDSIGKLFKANKAHQRAIDKAKQSQRSQYTKMYTDKDGRWIAAYAPIPHSPKNQTGFLVAKLQIDAFYTQLQRELQWLFLLSLSAVLLAILVGILFARRLNNALTQLTRGAEAIKLHNYHYHIQLDRRDELGLVAKQFNEMADVIAERIDMLKYLPKHTLEAIARRSRTGAVVETEYVKGTVVYTQLRGDLAISSELSPEEIIETLNRALQLQAEVFDRYGGVIDKLIGDGVLAVFKDFAHVHRAVEASLDIQEAVQALYPSKKHRETDEETDETAENDDDNIPSTPIEIGIGITTGYLVFGEVGSELRKERILIGPEVNLATRLGHLASAGEVIISDQVRHNLGKAIETTKTEEVEITGFEDNQIIHSVSTIKPFAAQETWTV